MFSKYESKLKNETAELNRKPKVPKLKLKKDKKHVKPRHSLLKQLLAEGNIVDTSLLRQLEHNQR